MDTSDHPSPSPNSLAGRLRRIADIAENAAHQFPLRSSRDRMMDLLDIAQPYPLRDVPVNHPPKVSFGDRLDITIQYSQTGVDYRLHDAYEREISAYPVENAVEGNGGDLPYPDPGPVIEEDTTFTILARRLSRTSVQNFLHHEIVVRVGIDKNVFATFYSLGVGDNFQLLTPNQYVAYDQDTRIQVGPVTVADPVAFVDSIILDSAFNRTIEDILAALRRKVQQGITYSVISNIYGEGEIIRSIDDVDDIEWPSNEKEQAGRREEVLHFKTGRFQEDIQLRIKAYRSDDPPDVDYLDTPLNLYVGPNLQRAVDLAKPIMLIGEENSVTLPEVQASDTYELYARLVVENEYQPDGTFRMGAGGFDKDAGGNFFPLIQGEAKSPRNRLIDGITVMLAQATLVGEDRDRLQRGLDHLRAANMLPNELRELLNILNKPENRAQWPDNISWVTDASTLSLTPGSLTRDAVFAVRVRKWEHDNLTQDLVREPDWLETQYYVRVLYRELATGFLASPVNGAYPKQIVIDYSTSVAVRLGISDSEISDGTIRSLPIWNRKTQPGISYVLVIHGPTPDQDTPVSDVVTGNFAALTIPSTRTFQEDLSGVRVKAFITGAPDRCDYLNTDLKVWVRPDANLKVYLENRVIAYGADTRVVVEGVQASTRYQLFTKRLDLLEYLPDGTLEVTDVESINGLVPVGAPRDGNDGATLRFDTGRREEDSVFVIQATKIDPANGSTLRLVTAPVLLVYPDPAPLVTASPDILSPQEAGWILIDQAQEGVAYQLFKLENGEEVYIGRKGYHYHDRAIAEIHARRAFGMRVGIDFKIGGVLDTPATLFPNGTLRLPTGPVLEPTQFFVRAVKSYTGLSVDLDRSARVDVPLNGEIMLRFMEGSDPKVTDPTELIIDYRVPVQVRLGQDPGEPGYQHRSGITQLDVSYVLVIAGASPDQDVEISHISEGNLATLDLVSKVGITEDASLRVKAWFTHTPSEMIYLNTGLNVWVRPDANLKVYLEAPIIDYGAHTQVVVEGIQASAQYQLFTKQLSLLEYLPNGTLEVTVVESISGLVPVGAPQNGTDGATLRFDTGVQQEDSLFVVQVTKMDPDNSSSLRLPTTPVVLVHPNPGVAVSTRQDTSGRLVEAILEGTQYGVSYRLYPSESGRLEGAPEREGYHFEERAVAERTDRRIYGMRVGIDFKIGAAGATPAQLFPTGTLRLPIDPDRFAGKEMVIVATKNYTGLTAEVPFALRFRQRLSFSSPLLQLSGSSSGIKSDVPLEDFRITGAAPRTAEAWIMPEKARGVIFAFGGTRNNGERQRWVNGSTWILRLKKDGADAILQLSVHNGVVSSTRKLTPGKWYHVACVFDPVADLPMDLNRVRLYIDGIEEPVNVGNNIQVDTGTAGGVEWGSSYDGNSFPGTLMELRLWNRARSQAEIQADLDFALNGGEPGLVGYWPLKDGDSTHANSGLGASQPPARIIDGSWK